jgi:large subunit ribosomal protein L28
MGRQCDITGKGTMFGNNVPRKGLARRKGGGGSKIGTKTRRTFKANLVSKKFYVAELEQNITLRVSTRALRSISKMGLNAFIKKYSQPA